jgi:hypothetical protein
MRHGGSIASHPQRTLQPSSPRQPSKKKQIGDHALTNVTMVQSLRADPAFRWPCRRQFAAEVAYVAGTCLSHRLPRRCSRWSTPAHGAATGTEGQFTYHACTWLALAYCSPRWEQPTEERARTNGLLSCASRASSIWLTALPIHKELTLCYSEFCNAFQFQLRLSPCPCLHPMCVVAVESLWTQPVVPMRQISSGTLISDPNLPSYGLHTTVFSVNTVVCSIHREYCGVCAKSCEQQGFPPCLSPIARRLQVHGLSLLHGIGQTFSPFCQPAAYSCLTSLWFIALLMHT